MNQFSITPALTISTISATSSNPAKRSVLTRCRLGFSALIVVLLTACASPITTQVTSFNQWPANATNSLFSFISRVDAGRELEQSTYESHVQTELQKQGLKRAPAGQTGRFQVDVTASNRREERTHLEPVYRDNYVYFPPYRDAAGRIFPGVWGPDPFGPRYIGDRQVNNQVQISNLQVRVLDSEGSLPNKSRAVFESRAVYEGQGSRENLPVVVPYLVRAVFDNFPGQNGQVRLVKFDRETGAVIKK